MDPTVNLVPELVAAYFTAGGLWVAWRFKLGWLWCGMLAWTLLSGVSSALQLLGGPTPLEALFHLFWVAAGIAGGYLLWDYIIADDEERRRKK